MKIRCIDAVLRVFCGNFALFFLKIYAKLNKKKTDEQD